MNYLYVFGIPIGVIVVLACAVWGYAIWDDLGSFNNDPKLRCENCGKKQRDSRMRRDSENVPLCHACFNAMIAEGKEE